jgi:hypothetical protein
VTGIEQGMSPREVVDLIGPPLDFMEPADLLGGAEFAVMTSGAAAQFKQKVHWLYIDIPNRGLETTVTFTNGAVSFARTQVYDASQREVVHHDWTYRLMINHLERMDRDWPDKRLIARPAWQRLATDEVLEFVETASAYPHAAGSIGRSAWRFGDLDVIVSLFEETDPDAIRAVMPDGYIPALSALVDGFGITPGKIDLAHWILGCASDTDTVAHLAFIPATRDLTFMVPWDLLSPAERARGSKAT